MAIVLEHRAELIINLLFNLLRRYNYYLARAPTPVSLVCMSLIVLLKPHVLVEAAKRQRKFEAMADPHRLGVRELVFEGEGDEVIFQLVDCEEALEARVHVAVVGIVLQSY